MGYLFCIATVICAIGWFFSFVAAKALMWYIDEKKLPRPTKDEIDQATGAVLDRMFKVQK